MLGQSPSGPLLDDEPGNWLDDAQAPLASERMPDSVVGGRFAADAASAESAASAHGGVYPSHGGGGWAMGPGASGGNACAEMAHCPSCGNSFSGACPACAPLAGIGSGMLSPEMMGLSGPIAGCQDLLNPMTHESWLFRPLSAGWFMGFMQGTDLIEDWVGQGQGFFGGYRFGWDYDPFWGCETRFGFASLALEDSERAKVAQAAADLANGITTSDPYYYRFGGRRDSGIRLWDVEMLWYPFGDTYFRPYFLLGLGTARVDFMDRLSERRIKSVFAMPIAIGFKYRVRDWLALRVEATDNYIADGGSSFKSQHNFSLTAGLEVRFGGTRTGYWPYYPGRHYW